LVNFAAYHTSMARRRRFLAQFNLLAFGAVLVLLIAGGAAGAAAQPATDPVGMPATEPAASPALAAAIAAEARSATTQPLGSARAVPIVQVFGDGAAMGRAEGQRLGPEMVLLNRDYLRQFISPSMVYWLLSREAQQFIPFLQPEELAEIRALAAASGEKESDVVFGQCFLDLIPMIACSTITVPGAGAPDHVARFGRNLDFPSLGIAHKHVVIIVYHPQGRYAFAAITWPGLIGVLSGMNEQGLSLASMEVVRLPRLPQAEPYILLYRQVLERCRTVDEAIDYLRSAGRQSANNLMLMDASGDRAVVEIQPGGIVVRRAPATVALISTNFQRGTDLDTLGRSWRYDCLHEESHNLFGNIDVPTLQGLLSDAMQRGLTIESMIFEPSNRVVYLAVGPLAAKRPLVRYDLRPYFAAKN
jgi:isopenicillin-N N-acyltransferase like protein